MNFKKEDIKGIVVPILTPVDEDENINYGKLCEVIDYVIANGVHGILAFGSNSEFYMFSNDEMIEATQVILNHVANRVPVYFGIGEIRTKHAVDLAVRAAKLNVTAISVLQPMFIKPTNEALYNHFRMIAEAVPEKLMLLYNNPGRCGYSIPMEIVARLANDLENIVGIKDSSGDLTYTSMLLSLTQDKQFKVLAGKDTVIYPSLSVGCSGAVCSTANIFPELVSGIYNLYEEGKYEQALKSQFILNPVRLSQDAASFPSPTKDMANLMGLDVGKSIRPTEGAQGEILEEMEKQMKLAKLLD